MAKCGLCAILERKGMLSVCILSLITSSATVHMNEGETVCPGVVGRPGRSRLKSLADGDLGGRSGRQRVRGGDG